MPLTHLVTLPAAPVAVSELADHVPARFRDEVAALRAAVDRVLERLPSTGTALLIDAGPESLVHDAASASLAGYGYPEVATDLHLATDLLAAVSARGQAPRVRGDRLSGDTAILALLLAATRPELAVAPITIPSGAGTGALHDVALGLRAAIDAVDAEVVAVAVGDLSASLDTASPGYLVEGAATWDATTAEAVAAGDLPRLGAQGPEEAQRVKARGWAPLTVGLDLALEAELSVETADYLVCRGVGRLVAGAS